MAGLEIKVLGPGCPKCELVERRVREALGASGLEGHVEKVTEISRMISYGIQSMPAVVVNGRIRSSGRIPRVEEIEAWIKESSE